MPVSGRIIIQNPEKCTRMGLSIDQITKSQHYFVSMILHTVKYHTEQYILYPKTSYTVLLQNRADVVEVVTLPLFSDNGLYN